MSEIDANIRNIKISLNKEPETAGELVGKEIVDKITSWKKETQRYPKLNISDITEL